MNCTVVCGDFNHRWNDGKFKLQQWAEENNWAAPSICHAANETVITLYSGLKAVSWIDH